MTRQIAAACELRSRALETIARLAALHRRSVTSVDLHVERDYITLQLSVDGGASVVHLGIRASTAINDTDAFDAELSRNVQLVLDARAAGVLDRQVTM